MVHASGFLNLNIFFIVEAGWYWCFKQWRTPALFYFILWSQTDQPNPAVRLCPNIFMMAAHHSVWPRSLQAAEMHLLLSEMYLGGGREGGREGWNIKCRQQTRETREQSMAIFLLGPHSHRPPHTNISDRLIIYNPLISLLSLSGNNSARGFEICKSCKQTFLIQRDIFTTNFSFDSNSVIFLCLAIIISCWKVQFEEL